MELKLSGVRNMRLAFEVHGGVEIDYSIGGSNNNFSEKARDVIESIGHECVNLSVMEKELSNAIELFLSDVVGGESDEYTILEKSLRCEITDENFKIDGDVSFKMLEDIDKDTYLSGSEIDYSDIVSDVFDELFNLDGWLINLDPLYKAMGDNSEVDFVAQYCKGYCKATLYLD